MTLTSASRKQWTQPEWNGVQQDFEEPPWSGEEIGRQEVRLATPYAG